MLFRSLLAALALVAAATASEAGPFRRHARPAYQPSYRPVYQPTYQPVYQSPTFTPTVTSAGYVSDSTPAVTVSSVLGTGFDGDGLDEVNAKRAARGLRPFLRDEGLMQAARACAQFRANHGLFGHTSNDFAFLPAGTFASSAGCAAYPADYGWMSCCVYEHHTYAGAGWVTGRDGRRYMQLFVR